MEEIKYTAEWCDQAWKCFLEYCKTVDSSVVVIKVRHDVDIILEKFWNNTVR